MEPPATQGYRDMALEKLLPREIPPPISDGWRPGHSRKIKKAFGLILFSNSLWWARRNPDNPLRASTVWYATERARDDAIAAANKPRQWLPVVAMQKVER